MNEKIKNYQDGLNTAFINGLFNSDLAYRPQFIYNDSKNGKKVLSSIEDELLSCDSFSISVAFITKSGITPLLQTLKELEKRQVKGRILTTDYLDFSDPEALDMLADFSNIELRMYQTRLANTAFHTKGYIFKKGEEYHFIIGSSNMTQNAMTKNMEWNTKLISTSDGEMLNSILDDFNKLWDSIEFTKEYHEFIDEYRLRYKSKQIYNKLVSEQMREVGHIFKENYELKPNSMQSSFIDNLKEMAKKGIDKAILISATGTGKTYASAFAARELGYKRVLFVVHRNQIAKQAKRSFDKVFNYQIKSGMLTGNKKELDADFVFATIQTLSKDEILNNIPRDYFEMCIYDEAHHTSASSYQKIMKYFKPKFSLGMTATPDKRNDDLKGENIYEIFDHNIAYEIRLKQAMEEDLLCPFHYFGITDLEMIKDSGDLAFEDTNNFRHLTSDERVRNIINSANFYGYSGDRVKGLIFCSRIEEAKELSDKLNQYGLKTISLSGSDSENERNKAIDRLVMDVEDGDEDYLDYILTVDIFSEGTDIVEVNQIIMLRPTQSPIVFIQQLGRGLRKSEGKEYVVILDFIGNYNNNFMIPIALSGDRSYNKDNIRRFLVEGDRIIPGASTIHFDEISRKRIFESIDNANFSDIKLIKENYLNLKNKLGRIPRLKEFDEYGEMDVLRIFDNKNLGSYYNFLIKYDKDYKIKLSNEEVNILQFISTKLASGKRVHELLLLETMINGVKDNLFIELSKELKNRYNLEINELVKENIINMMTNKFANQANRTTFKDAVFVTFDNDDYKIDDNFNKLLNNEEFVYELKEVVEFGISRYERDYINHYKDTNLVLYQKYTYEDVCRLLNWKINVVAQNIGGYFYDERTKTFPVFINYIKSDDISDTINYEDHFTSSSSLIAISKSRRNIYSKDVQNFLNAKSRGIDIHLFVRKNKDDKTSKEFYYLGTMEASGNVQEFIMPNTQNVKAVEIEWLLDVPIREDIYKYIVNE